MANIGNFAFCSNAVCRVFSLSLGLLMIFNFLNKSARCEWRKGGLIQYQWKDLVGELQVWVKCDVVWFSVVLSKSTEYLCSLEKRHFGGGEWQSVLQHPARMRLSKCCQSSVLHKVLLNWAQKTQTLIQSQASQQHRDRDAIMSNPSDLCAEGTSLEFQLNALNID